MGKMQEELSNIDNNSIDCIITDPPYELNFMGKGWDNSGVAFQRETWKHCYNKLKDGGYLLAFGGSRTFHRIACAIEDAGFEIRDTIMWIYGSGFPKSQDIAKSIEGKLTTGSANTKDFKNLNGELVDKGGWGIAKLAADYGYRDKNYDVLDGKRLGKLEPTTELAKQWQGWGTALKPAYEPIIIARKPFSGTLTDNIIENGVGALNIDGCRIPTNGELIDNHNVSGTPFMRESSEYHQNSRDKIDNGGRFPANVILTYDDTDEQEVCGGFPDTNGSKSVANYDKSTSGAIYGFANNGNIKSENHFDDSGSASRYFYCAKASKKDRDDGLYFEDEKQGGSYQFREDGSLDGKIPSRKNIHPTVKPTELMQYLIRLVAPNEATILDPFMGSGSTGKACMIENVERHSNYHFIGVEMTPEYLPICEARIKFGLGYVPEITSDGTQTGKVVKKPQKKGLF